MQNGYPVPYSAIDTTYGGHTFILDGYNEMDEFHINWGWHGDFNEFYALNILNPDNLNFFLDHRAIFNLHPVLPPGVSISSPSAICTNTMVTVNNLPSGAYVEWIYSPNLTLNTAQGISPATFTANTNGEAWIDAKVHYNNGVAKLFRKSVWAGKPVLEGISGPSNPKQGTMQYYTATGTNLPLQAITNYIWEFTPYHCLTTDPNCWYCVWGTCNGTMAKVRIGGPANQVNYIVVQAENACGLSFTRSKGVVPSPGTVLPPIPLIASNVVDESIEVSFVDAETKEKIEAGTYSFSLELYDTFNQLKVKAKSKGDKVSLRTREIKDGFYILQITCSDKKYSERIRVEHQ